MAQHIGAAAGIAAAALLGLAACGGGSSNPATCAYDGSQGPCGAGQACWGGACTPVRTITGSSTATFWGSAGPGTTLPGKIASVFAIVRGPGGGETRLPGVALPDGTFSVPMVPVGLGYLLELNGTSFVAATGDAVDLGWDVVGRPFQVRPTGPTPLHLELTGLEPIGDPAHDGVALVVGNAGMAALVAGAGDGTPAGATAISADVDLWANPLAPLPSAARGDAIDLLQTNRRLLPVGQPGAGLAIDEAVAHARVTGLSIVDRVGGTLAAALAPLPRTGALTVDYRTTAWAAAAAEMSPALAQSIQQVAVRLLPAPLAPRSPIWNGPVPPAVLAFEPFPAGPDLALGDLPYAELPGTGWRPYLDVADVGMVPVEASPGAQPYPLAVLTTSSRPLPLAAGPIAPRLTAPRLPCIGGRDVGGAPVTGVGTTPVLSWSPPALGAPDRYDVYLVEVAPVDYGSGPVTWVQLIADLHTAATEIRLPSGLVRRAAGLSYVAIVRAVAEPGSSATAPNRQALPRDVADLATATFSP